MRSVVTVAAIVLVASSALATTVRHTELPELVAQSQIVLRAHVAFVDDRAGEAQGKFKTRIGFEVDEAVKGISDTTLEVVLPGGKSGQLTMAIPGMPTFKTGDEVVLLVQRLEGGDAITGMGEGVFKVDRSSGVANVSQPFISAMHVIDAKGREVRNAAIATTLSDLMTRLHSHAKGGVQ